MGKKENTDRRAMEAIRLETRQAIQQAAENALAVTDPIGFLGAFRKLRSTVERCYTDYIFSLKGIDTLQGLPENCTEETMQWISDRQLVLLEFINSPRLQELLKRYDPVKASGEYPFFTYLESTLKKDTQKLEEAQSREAQSHGVTNAFDPGRKTVSEAVLRRIRELLETKARVTQADYEAIARGLGISVRDVLRALQISGDVQQQAELNRTVGEDDEEELQDFVKSGSEAPWQMPEAKEQDVLGSRWQKLEQAFLERLTKPQQRIFALYTTVQLIRQELARLLKREGKPDLESLAALFREEPDLALQTLKNLKYTYTRRETPLICPEMFDLAMEKRAVPTQKDMAQILQVTTANISKTYKQALEKLQ